MTVNNPKAPQRQRILALTNTGMKPREIAAALGISTQRVYAALERLRELGELRDGKAS